MGKLLKNSIVYLCLIGIIGVAFLAERKPVAEYAGNVADFVKKYADEGTGAVEEVRQEIFSQPLRAHRSDRSSVLVPSSIIEITNSERAQNGLLALAENADLNQAAMNKVQDMFDRQYFEHVSPDGKGPGSLADNVGYSYIVVGENLALGTFSDDADLVKAWMASPGHRANILNERYLEIGVAVGQGLFAGEHVWLAVQEFGKPKGSCPAINIDLNIRIEEDKSALSGMGANIAKIRQELDGMRYVSPEESRIYNEKVSVYNDLVARYNALSAELKRNIEIYNAGVRTFNACARG